MSTKPGRNQPCPCGSGLKYKKCCGGVLANEQGLPVSGSNPGYDQNDRGTALTKQDAFIDAEWQDEEEFASEEFWGRFFDREDELPPDMLAMSRDVQEMWFALDHRLEDNGRIVDRFLDRPGLGTPERSYLQALAQTSMRLYEVATLVPGTSITLRDVITGSEVTVNERTASRTLSRHDWLAARVISRGCTGGPEIERGVLPIPIPYRDSVLRSLQRHLTQYQKDHPGEPERERWRELPPLFHEAWLTAILDPQIPELHNTDGEPMLTTRLSFEVQDVPKLIRAFDGAIAEGVENAGDGEWTWSGPSANRSCVLLASLRLRDDRLVVETNSLARGQRAQALIERLAGGNLRHQSTTLEDLQRQIKDAVSARARDVTPDASPPTPLDPDIVEAFVLGEQARHYRAWVDEPVPALDGHTPRHAAGDPRLRPKVEDLVRTLENMYERALKDGQPAYDPSWMWTELGLGADDDVTHPPLLAHERVANAMPGLAQAIKDLAERRRKHAPFSDASTLMSPEETRRDLDLQRFLREGTDVAPHLVEPYLPLLLNLDLHRRKVFWVDPALAFLLENTDIDVAGGELRCPFPVFAVVFTDRHSLSLGERLLSRHTHDPLRGQILRVITAYVMERTTEVGRTLSVTFAFDALGADLPSLLEHEIPAAGEVSLRSYLDKVTPSPASEPAAPNSSPIRALLRLVLNAILYATSAGVSSEMRAPPKRRQPKTRTTPPSSDSVYYLPGKIDIRQVRRLQELHRSPQGPELLARFMVRGHWRRPAKNWQDQGMRWIEPYWKGPDLAAVIEKAYRLRI